MTITRTNIWDLWRELLWHLTSAPRVDPRGKPTRELLNVRLWLENARANVLVHPARDLNYRFMVAEWLWILFGRNDLVTIARYNSRMREFSDDGVTLAGAYGPRFVDQLDYVVDAIATDHETRRAVLTFWRPNPNLASRDVPCTLTAQFLVRDARLTAIFTMRSSDAWLGIPYDVFTFSMLANYVRARLVKTGMSLKQKFELIVQLGSSHLYEEHVQVATTVLATCESGDALRSPTLVTEPPVDVALALVEHVQTRTDKAIRADGEWLPYVRVLMSTSRKTALQILKEEEPDETDD